MYEKNLNYLFNEVSLYTKEKFEVLNLQDDQYILNKQELDKFLCYIGCAEERLITICHKCKKEFPFSLKKELLEFLCGDLVSQYNLEITKGYQTDCGKISLSNSRIMGAQPPYEKNKILNNKIWYYLYSFTCTNNNSHNYTMLISIEFNDGQITVIKVGQNPSMLSVKGFDFDKYKKQLDELSAYEDYKKADLSNADHFYVGAYAYLRRIFEKMIKKYLGDNKTKDDHIDTKIDAVKDRFDPRVQKLLKSLYGILSISIHELDEEQSKKYYIYLKTIIDMQLEYVKTEADKEQQSKSLESIINKISTGLSSMGKQKR